VLTRPASAVRPRRNQPAAKGSTAASAVADEWVPACAGTNSVP